MTTQNVINNTLGVATATSLAFTSTGELIGTTTNNNAAAGSVGQYVSADNSASAVSITSGNFITATSISLGAGDWDVCATYAYNPNVGTTVNYITGSISLVNNTVDGTPGQVFIQSYGGQVVNNFIATVYGHVLPVRMSLSTTTTVYAVTSGGFGVSTMTSWAMIRARRIR